GQKMSKSKGNIIDPLELIDEYGADSLRFTLAAMAAQGRDIKLATSRVEGYRNFATKLWNAARFCEMNGCVRTAGFDPAGLSETINRWIVGETQKAATTVTEAIEAYRFNDAAGGVYRFVWNVFCDWYLELAKPILNGKDEAAIAETRATAAWALDRILILLHPFMPFVTEELWSATGEAGPARETMLIEAEWPALSGLIDGQADADINWLIEAISAVRSARSEMNVPPSAELRLALIDADRVVRERVATYDTLVKRLARLSEISFADAVPEGAIQVLLGQTVGALPLADVIDIAGERARLEKELKKIDGEITGIEKKLANEQFLAKAPDHVIEEQHERRADASARRGKLADALSRLGA
ncbi:MAG: class I tRNA ligase family protein, partial [Rhodobiaceae bacterium]|nr:class I tRNA ligase family protein [Rhodobiaceae bacterium]